MPVFRELAWLRERLVDHLSAAVATTVTTDVPLMRPRFFDHSGSAEVWQHPQQWMLGADLLVSPVTSPGATTWPVWLPEGQWLDVWTDDPVPGGQVVERDIPIDVVKVWCRVEARSSLAAVFEQTFDDRVDT